MTLQKISSSTSTDKTKSGVEVCTTYLSFYIPNVGIGSVRLVHSTEYRWKSTVRDGEQFSGNGSSDGNRDGFTTYLNVEKTEYEVPRINQLSIDRTTCYTQSEIDDMLSKVGVTKDDILSLI